MTRTTDSCSVPLTTAPRPSVSRGARGARRQCGEAASATRGAIAIAVAGEFKEQRTSLDTRARLQGANNADNADDLKAQTTARPSRLKQSSSAHDGVYAIRLARHASSCSLGAKRVADALVFVHVDRLGVGVALREAAIAHADLAALPAIDTAPEPPAGGQE